MNFDKLGGNIHPLERRKEIEVGDRVRVKRELLEKYVRDAKVPEVDILKWRERRAEAQAQNDETFLDRVAHPKVEVVGSPQLYVQDKMPGKLKLGTLPNSERYVWVDIADVEHIT